jgi:NitT/TauT family transport system substrate-binding protein
MVRLVLGGILSLMLAGSTLPPAWAQLPVVHISSFDKPSFGHTMATLIEANGFDKKNGVDIQWVFKESRAANTDFAAGRDKITLASALLSEANRRLQGIKSVILFNVVNLHGALLTSDPKIRSLKDLDGRTIAANTVTTNYAMFRYFAMKAGVDLKKLQVQSATTAGLTALLLAKRADAVHVWEPQYSQILHDNPGRFTMIEYVHQWDAIHGRPQRGNLTITAHEDWIAGNHDLIPKIYKAFKDLAAWLPGHYDQASGMIAEATGIAPGAILMALMGNRYPADVVPAANIKDSIHAIFRAGVESGYMKGLPDDGIIYTGLKE